MGTEKMRHPPRKPTRPPRPLPDCPPRTKLPRRNKPWNMRIIRVRNELDQWVRCDSDWMLHVTVHSNETNLANPQLTTTFLWYRMNSLLIGMNRLSSALSV